MLRDTQADAASMENHAQREEIRQALTTGSGSSVRYSDTLTEKTVYEAVRLSDGSVLRIAGGQKTVGMLVLGLLHAVIAVALLAGRAVRPAGKPRRKAGSGSFEPTRFGAPDGK